MSIQSSYRMYLQKKKYNDILSKIITIQKWWKSKDIYKNKVIKIYALKNFTKKEIKNLKITTQKYKTQKMTVNLTITILYIKIFNHNYFNLKS